MQFTVYVSVQYVGNVFWDLKSAVVYCFKLCQWFHFQDNLITGTLSYERMYDPHSYDMADVKEGHTGTKSENRAADEKRERRDK